MAKTTGLGDAFYIGGTDVSGDVNSLSRISGGPNPGDFTDITQSAHARQGLLRDGGIDFAVYMDSALAHPVLSALPTADVIATYFNQRAIGNPAASCVAKEIDYNWNRGQEGNLLGSVALQADAFGLEWGNQVTPGIRTDTVATDAQTANSWDTGGALSFGAQLYVHLFAFTGTSVTFKIKHSTDNITFGDLAPSLITSALTSAPQAVRVTVPNTTTVNRYVGLATIGTFSNAQFAAMLVKNQSAGVSF
jgi:hypothetical protein